MWIINMLSRKKEVSTMDIMSTNLKRCLTSYDVTLLGIGHMLGSGIYVLSPSIARGTTGPALILSYLIAGVASLLAALAYADFGVRYPRSGSAYSYVYYSIGEFWAFFVGWNVLLENMLATAACVRACSAYIDSLTGYVVFNGTRAIMGEFSTTDPYLSEVPDFLAFAILMGFVIFMTFGVKTTSGLNNTLVGINVVVLATVVGVGFYYADFDNWKYHENNANFVKEDHPEFINGFMPYGISGVLQMYFADISSTSGLLEALKFHQAYWAQYIVSAGALAGMSTVIMATVFAMTRVGYAMAEDGLLFTSFSIVLNKSQVPVVSMYVLSLLSAICACMLNTEALVDMLSIGTLLAYMIVACALLISKYTPLDVVIELENSSARDGPELIDSSRPSTVHTFPEDLQISDGLHCITVMNASPTDLHGLKPSFRFLRQFLPSSYGQRQLVVVCLAITFIATILAAFIVKYNRYIANGPTWMVYLGWTIASISVITIIICGLLIFAHELPGNSNFSNDQYSMPWVPILPIFSIIFNAGLIVTLDLITWIRLIIWLAIGSAVYFGYGIHHSRLNRKKK
ncbi:probable cationic amino acid transporter isoform X2 [Varroa destructor]|uniref:Cationic amino acid transporter C-terminal domain-containing protein n=1 Tax=Varroa destructor TaxID=109461 RepID=A0A7M7JMP5_VARDE|nr:probable cationic amino acid transporter isoform X2 [Varroa destructor]